jgi:hypothetical protein
MMIWNAQVENTITQTETDFDVNYYVNDPPNSGPITSSDFGTLLKLRLKCQSHMNGFVLTKIDCQILVSVRNFSQTPSSNNYNYNGQIFSLPNIARNNFLLILKVSLLPVDLSATKLTVDTNYQAHIWTVVQATIETD